MNERMTQKSGSRVVAIWLLTGVGMIMVQVLLGGITRLTGSGLSITEWKPILGAFPPMNEQDWVAAFSKYKEIGQFKHINFDFTLSDFKFIYFWEWFHRVWARLIGLVFLIPFIYFLWKKLISREMVIPMIILFLFGAIQGALGWIMVKSGLNEENLYVSHIRLAIHFLAALGLLWYTLWFSLKLLIPESARTFGPDLKKNTHFLLGLLVIQLIYGAFMAGLKAGAFAPTWPTMNGQWWPAGITEAKGSFFLTDNPITVQFIHRGLAYLISILIISWYLIARKLSGAAIFSRYRYLPVLLVILQVVLGIFTVVYSDNSRTLLWLGVSHQFVAMLLMMSLVFMAYLLNGKKPLPQS
jgi:cytochrome c oxidase assembly protein subunit 15